MARNGKTDPSSPSLFDPSPPDHHSLPELPAAWREVLEPQTLQPYWPELMRFLAAERAGATILPPESDVFHAFRATPLDRVKVLILGQDPYPTPGVAHGLCFSVQPGVKVPASLRNIYRELHDDLGIQPVAHGCLKTWAKRGVLLLNACLTVRAGEPNSHAGRGWEKFTDAAIRAVNELPRPVVFLLWGGFAKKKAKRIDAARHAVIAGVHPSPLSASGGFFGSKPFSKVNAALVAAGQEPIDWRLPESAGDRIPGRNSSVR
jgi:uracil-DNA glycosylase